MQEPKISIVEAYFLIVFAIIADLINWIPIINILTTIVTLPVFQFYFMIKGVKGIYSLAGNIAELIPGLSVLPAITAGVVTTIIVDRVQAKTGVDVTKTIKPKAKASVTVATEPEQTSVTAVTEPEQK